MLDVAAGWVKSTYCADTSCVEVSAMDDDVLLRDGKNEDAPFLRFSRSEWNDFLEGIAAGDFRF
jgi:hypothetical protein